MKKTILSILIISMLTLLLGTSVISANFGSGVETIAEDVKIIKTGIYGRKLTFSDADFKQGLCITDFNSVEITKIPSSTEGALMLAGRRIGEGTVIKRKNIPALVFIPASKDVSECSFRFKIDEYAQGSEIEFVLKFTDKINYEPETKNQSADSLSLLTQREIGVHGKMYATDNEKDAIEYIIVSYPKYGTLTIVDKSTGEYIYTPAASYVGSDSFVYVARDEWGNFSEAQKVNITVSKRMSEVEYRDMIKRPEYNAAVAMTAMGIMGGKIVGDGVYFNPDETVTRAEFISMAMKTLGIKADGAASQTYFDDNGDIPQALLGYVSAAQKMGLAHGSFKDGKLLFRPNDAITKYEAAVIMAELLDTKVDGDVPVFSNISSIPAWARNDVYAMCSLGIFEHDGLTVDANSTVSRADCAHYLYKMLNI